jgi:glycosyltransferase involved in cell wall biosynthesis
MDIRASLSACVLTLNARERVEPCVASLGFADEILVLDSGSTDGTAELCRGLGCRVEEHVFQDYATQRNLCAALAKHDWVLFVDADERVDAELAEAIQEALRAGPPPVPAFALRRRNHYLGRWLRHGAWEPDLVVRLYDRGHARWEGAVHERLRLDASVRPRLLPGTLEHRSFRTLSEQLERLDRYTSMAAERPVRWPLLHLILRPPARFLRAYVLKLGFLEGRVGLVQAGMTAFAAFLKYAKHLERSLRR